MAIPKHEPIHLSTYGDLARYGYRLTAFCRPCSRHVEIDPATLPAAKDYVRTAFVCRDCGMRAELTLGYPSRLTGFGAMISYKRKV